VLKHFPPTSKIEKALEAEFYWINKWFENVLLKGNMVSKHHTCPFEFLSIIWLEELPNYPLRYGNFKSHLYFMAICSSIFFDRCNSIQSSPMGFGKCQFLLQVSREIFQIGKLKEEEIRRRRRNATLELQYQRITST